MELNLQRSVRVLALAIGALMAGNSAAQSAANCRPDAGEPARAIESYGDLEGKPYEVVAAAGSRATQTNFTIQDAAGRGISNVQVEIVLPSEPADLRFLELGAPGFTAKRAVIAIGALCHAYGWPSMVVGSTPQTVNATMRVLGRPGEIAIPIRAINAMSMVRYTDPRGTPPQPPVPLAIAMGEVVIPGAGAWWADGSRSGGVSGVAITITAPAGEPSLRFPDGAKTWVAGTDYNGIASVQATPTGPGVIQTRITYPDGTTVDGARYVVVGERSVALAPTGYEYGKRDVRIEGTVSFSPWECGAGYSSSLTAADVRLKVGGAVIDADVREGWGANPFTCSNGVARLNISGSLARLPIGVHEVTAELAPSVFPAATSAPVRVQVQPSFTLMSTTGRSGIRMGSNDPGYPAQTTHCRVRSAEAVALSAVGADPGPPGVELPYGAMRFELGDCTMSTASGFPAVGIATAQAVLLELDEEPATGTVAWAYGPTASQSTPHWYELRTSAVGRYVQFEITDGALGDSALGTDRTIRSLVTLGVPKYAAVAGRFQDLWWAGPLENGWGLSLTQHRDILWGALYIYDINGDARWLTMSGGSWNAAGTTFTGNLYRPRGSINHSALSQTFVPGEPVGVARLTPTSRDAITFDYTIDGVTSSKQITRLPFGPAYPFPVTRIDDLWWAGPLQNGWGLTLAQQNLNYFGLIYTYDDQGNTTWFVAPDLVANNERQITGPLYATKGSPWLGYPYDPTKLRVTDVGSVRFNFSNAEESLLIARIAGRSDVHVSISRLPF